MRYTHPSFSRITIDPQMCFGKPCIRGMRMPVSSILGYLSSGMSIEEVLEDFPFLEREDILEALSFSAVAMEDRYLELGEAS